MGTVVNTNVAAIYARTNLSGAQNALSTSVERLSSGLRINRAKDDAAGLGISEVLKGQITSVNKSIRNANDAISVIQIAEGALTEVSDILIRMKELGTQAYNGTNNTAQMTAINDELKALGSEILQIKTRTTYNGISLLTGSAGSSGVTTFQVGADSTDVMTVTFSNITSGTAMSAVATTSGPSFTAGGAASALSTIAAYLENVETAIIDIGTIRGTLGAVQNRLEFAIENLQAQSENMQAANSRIVDTDFAEETAELTRTQIMQQAATAMLAQANQMPNVILALLK